MLPRTFWFAYMSCSCVQQDQHQRAPAKRVPQAGTVATLNPHHRPRPACSKFRALATCACRCCLSLGHVLMTLVSVSALGCLQQLGPAPAGSWRQAERGFPGQGCSCCPHSRPLPSIGHTSCALCRGELCASLASAVSRANACLRRPLPTCLQLPQPCSISWLKVQVCCAEQNWLPLPHLRSCADV